MKKMNALLALLFIALFSCIVTAADVPQDDEGAQDYNKMECVDDRTQTCIDDACLNSESTDCQENCQKMAAEKCQEEENE